MTSDAPRTDGKVDEYRPSEVLVGLANFARTLERELSAATARAEELATMHGKCSDKCAQLHAEIKSGRDLMDATKGMRDGAIQRAIAAEAKLEAAERDARRLDWLESHKEPDLYLYIWRSLLGLWGVECGNGDDFEDFETEDLIDGTRHTIREALDAAIDAEAKHGRP